MHSCIRTTPAVFAEHRSTKTRAGRLCGLRQVAGTVIQPDNCKPKAVKGPPAGYGIKARHITGSRCFQPENKKAAISWQTDDGNGMTHGIINNLNNYIIAYPGGHSNCFYEKKSRKVQRKECKFMENTFLSTREFAKQVGVSSQTIRRWDKMGKLKPHHKTPCGYRYYTQEQVTEMFNPDFTDTTERGMAK